MYKVLKIKHAQITSRIDLLNLESGTIEQRVFDDSDVFDEGFGNFRFMEVGGIYDCKLMLVDGAGFVPEKTERSLELELIDSKVIIGDGEYCKFSSGKDIYYVISSDTEGIDMSGKLYYDVIRKDLIQVNDIIHGDCFKRYNYKD